MSSSLKQKGSVLVYSLIILSIMLVAALAISSSAALDIKSSLATQKSGQALQAADSAGEIVFAKFLKTTKEAPGATVEDLKESSQTCSDGTISVAVERGEANVSFYGSTNNKLGCSDNISDIRFIKSIGTFNGVARAIQVYVGS